MPLVGKRLLLLLGVCLFAAGSLLGAFCTQCGRKLPVKARFCPVCGTRAVQATGERGGADEPGVGASAAGAKPDGAAPGPTREPPFLLVTDPFPPPPKSASRRPSTAPAPRFKRIAAADRLFARAEELRLDMNPFQKKSNYKKAIRVYKQVVSQYPRSDKHELSLFQLGNINESMFYARYRKAAQYYEQVVKVNPATRTSARYRLAGLYLNQLRDRQRALYWYRRALEHRDGDAEARAAARAAVAELEKEFGPELPSKPRARPPVNSTRPTPPAGKPGMGALSLRLRDSRSGRPPRKAEVVVLGPERRKPAAVDGSVGFRDLPPGTYRVEVRASGYRTRTGLVTLGPGAGLRRSGWVLLSPAPAGKSGKPPPSPDYIAVQVRGNLDAAEKARLRARIISERDRIVARLKRREETDPRRVANRKAAMAQAGKPRVVKCGKCGYNGVHWWIGDRWSCPKCGHGTMLKDLDAGNGKTYGQVTAAIIKEYEDKIAAVRAEAERKLAALR